jgi:hypothetical protein
MSSKTPNRYLKGVNKTQREKDIKSRKESNKPLKDLFPKKTDKEAIKKGIVKKSTYTTKFNKEYPDVKYSLSGFSKKFKIPLKDLKEVEEKGIKAWKTSGSRPGVPAIAWGKARVYKFILIEKGKIPKKQKDPDNYLHKKV